MKDKASTWTMANRAWFLMEFHHTESEMTAGRNIDSWVKEKPFQGEFIAAGHAKMTYRHIYHSWAHENVFETVIQLLGFINTIFR